MSCWDPAVQDLATEESAAERRASRRAEPELAGQAAAMPREVRQFARHSQEGLAADPVRRFWASVGGLEVRLPTLRGWAHHQHYHEAGRIGRARAD